MRERKSLKFIFRTALMFCAVFALLVFSPIISKAEANPGIQVKESTLLLYKGNVTNLFRVFNIQNGDKISATSSNKKIATTRVKKYKSEGKTYQGIAVTPQKAGTTTITCTVQRGSKSFKSTAKVNVITYKNPLKSFKYAGTEYATKLNEKTFFHVKNKKNEGKISVKANSEWNIVGIVTYSNKNGKVKNWNNNKNVSVKNMTQLSVIVQNKKNKNIEITVGLSFD